MTPAPCPLSNTSALMGPPVWVRGSTCHKQEVGGVRQQEVGGVRQQEAGGVRQQLQHASSHISVDTGAQVRVRVERVDGAALIAGHKDVGGEGVEGHGRHATAVPFQHGCSASEPVRVGGRRLNVHRCTHNVIAAHWHLPASTCQCSSLTRLSTSTDMFTLPRPLSLIVSCRIVPPRHHPTTPPPPPPPPPPTPPARAPGAFRNGQSLVLWPVCPGA